MDEQSVNEDLHAISLDLAYIWRESYANRGKISDDQWDAVMEAYIHVRHAITKGKDGRRFGARAAYKAMQGDV